MTTMSKLSPSRLCILGFAFGLLFVVAGWAFELTELGLPVAFSSVAPIHNADHTLYIVDTAPLVLGSIFLILGRAYSKAREDVELSSGEEVLNSALETMVDGFITTTVDGTIVLFNQAAERMFGYKSEEIRGEKISVLMPSYFDLTERKSVRSFIKPGQRSVRVESRRDVDGRNKDGSVIPLSLTVSELNIGKSSRFSLVLRDVTDVVRTQAESERITKELVQFVDTANAPIFGIDSHGLVNEWNQTAAEVTGCEKLEVLG